MTTAMPAAMSPYSIAVAPFSFWRKREISSAMVFTLAVKWERQEGMGSKAILSAFLRRTLINVYDPQQSDAQASSYERSL